MPAPQRPSNSRKPPTFKSHHLDPQRARKLKREWLAAQKIKAAYRAEKRRLGSHKPLTTDNARPDEGSMRLDESNTVTEIQSLNEVHFGHERDGSPQMGDDGGSHSALNDIKGRGRHGTSHKGKGKDVEKGGGDSNVATQPSGPSLRELAREAYSPASLHTHKSNPLRHKQRSARHPAGAIAREGRSASGGGKGRGQPDMAKRMGVLLEKLKRSS